MSPYYAVPVRRERNTLFYNPLDGNCALRPALHGIELSFGLPDKGQLFAVWRLNENISLEEAGRIASLVRPQWIFIMADSVTPLQLSPNAVSNALMESPRAEAN